MNEQASLGFFIAVGGGEDTGSHEADAEQRKRKERVIEVGGRERGESSHGIERIHIDC